MSGGDIRTDRLTLRPATPAALEAALGGPGRLGPALGVAVPATWPPEYVDDDALRWGLNSIPVVSKDTATHRAVPPSTATTPARHRTMPLSRAWAKVESA